MIEPMTVKSWNRGTWSCPGHRRDSATLRGAEFRAESGRSI